MALNNMDCRACNWQENIDKIDQIQQKYPIVNIVSKKVLGNYVTK